MKKNLLKTDVYWRINNGIVLRFLGTDPEGCWTEWLITMPQNNKLSSVFIERIKHVMFA